MRCFLRAPWDRFLQQGGLRAIILSNGAGVDFDVARLQVELHPEHQVGVIGSDVQVARIWQVVSGLLRKNEFFFELTKGRKQNAEWQGTFGVWLSVICRGAITPSSVPHRIT